MIILWIRKHKADKENTLKKDDTFENHDDIMKRFRSAHPDINYTSNRDILTSEDSLLAPVHQVKLAENIQN
jgi:hypothetical protein